MNESFRSYQLLLRKLYFSKYLKRGRFVDFFKESGNGYTEQYVYVLLARMVQDGILIKLFEADERGCYYKVSRDKIFNKLYQDSLFLLDYAIINENATVLIDNVPKVDPNLLR